jgi:exosortase/archaeosortase family protein
MRVDWVESHLLLPFTMLQGRLGAGICGPASSPVQTTLACSGSDAMALCLGVILAYPARWGVRLAGACGGLALILVLNTLRIGTLGRVAASRQLFELMHVYLWPALLIIAIAVYVFAWMRFADTRGEAGPTPSRSALHPSRPTRRFIILTVLFMILFVAASPLYLKSKLVLAVAKSITSTASVILDLLGLTAKASGNILSTPRGSFMVTQECISTPLIPVYLAAVVAYSRRWGRGTLALLAAGPIFFALGVARLLVVALPVALVASPLFLIHAFYQILTAAVLVGLAAVWRHGAGLAALRRSLLGIALGLLFARLLGASYALIVDGSARTLGNLLFPAIAAGPPPLDPQGAIALLPAFQAGLYLALWVAAFVPLGWRRHVAGVALLGLTQMATLLLLRFLFDTAGLSLHVREIRAWSLVAPLVVLALMHLGRMPRRSDPATTG